MIQTITLIIIALVLIAIAIIQYKEYQLYLDKLSYDKNKDDNTEEILLLPNEIIMLLDMFINNNISSWKEDDLANLIAKGFIGKDNEDKLILSQQGLDYINEIQIYFND